MSTSPYRHVSRLAEGGMGTVELVVKRQGSFRRLAALKRLLPAFRADTSLRSMFVDEARVAGLIRHPNVVPVLDVGEDDEGPFLVMELVEGVSLARLVGSSAEHGLLPVINCLEIAGQVAEGLAAAHELAGPDGRPLELVHRDLTPSNVLIGFDGVARVTDFGIAKVAGQSVKTSTGILKGKPSYMAPEQLRFEIPDQRADLFSLGVLLFEMLTGGRLYGGKGVRMETVAQRILHEPPPDILEHRREVPDALAELLFELLAKQPADRPASAREVAERLRAMSRELMFEEDAADLREVLALRFAAQRDEQQRRNQEALAAPTFVSEETPTPTDASLSEAPPRRLRGWIWALAAVLVGVPAVAAAGYATTRAVTPDGEMDGVGTSSAVAPTAGGALGAGGAAAPTAPDAPRAADAANDDVSGDDVSGDDVSGDDVSGDDVSDEGSETPPDARHRRRPGRAVRRRGRTHRGGVTTWDWPGR